MIIGKNGKTAEELPLNCVIMAPKMLTPILEEIA